jgi:hypothetical protein
MERKVHKLAAGLTLARQSKFLVAFRPTDPPIAKLFL